jgi:hypothetical protein
MVDPLDDVDLDQSTLQTDLILQFLNGPDATEAVLDNDVGLDSRAANGIVAHVRGPDGVLGTADDNPLGDIAELDAVAYVGSAAITAIDKYVVAKYGMTPAPTPTPTPAPAPAGQTVTMKGVTFTEAERACVIDLVNNKWGDVLTLGLSKLAIQNLLARRPFATIDDIAATPYVGTASLTALRNWADAHPLPDPGPGPAIPAGGGCKGGTFDTVFFTPGEECLALSFLNGARYSEMNKIPDKPRYVAYCGTGTAGCAFRATKWTSLAQYSDTTGVGTTAMTALRDSVRPTWSPNGLSWDTVAATWANRAALKDKPVYFDKVLITRLLPDYNDGTFGYWCAELRDGAGAANYLTACYRAIGADSATACQNVNCFTGTAGKFASLRGTLQATNQPATGGWRVMLVSAAPAAANPAVH